MMVVPLSRFAFSTIFLIQQRKVDSGHSGLLTELQQVQTNPQEKIRLETHYARVMQCVR